MTISFLPSTLLRINNKKIYCASQNKRSQNAQIVAEYAITFFIVIAVVSAMTMYVKRAIQGRLRDARNTMIETARESGADVKYEYEPYYVNTQSTVSTQSTVTSGTVASGLGSSGIARTSMDTETKVETQSSQLPPKDAE